MQRLAEYYSSVCIVSFYESDDLFGSCLLHLGYEVTGTRNKILTFKFQQNNRFYLTSLFPI